MSDSIVVALIVLAGGVVTAVVSLIVARWSARAIIRGGEIQAEASRPTAAQDYQRFVADQRAEIQGLREIVQRLQPRVESLEAEVGHLKQRMADVVRRYRSAMKYVRALRLYINVHLPDREDMPPLPDDLLEQIDATD